MRTARGISGALVACLALTGAAGPGVAIADTKCKLDGTTLRVTLNEKHDVGIFKVDSGAIVVEGFGPVSCGGAAATTTNTDLIRVRDRSGGNTQVIVSHVGGDFAPGATDAGDQDPDPLVNPNEIEWSVRMRSGAHDNFSLFGKTTPASVNFRWGAGGINLNVHSTFLLANDADISLTGAEDLLVFTAGGNDIVSAAGGAGTGDPFPRSLWFDDPYGGDDIQVGGAGDDLIFNGPDADTFLGGKGRDTVRYQGSEPITVTIGSGLGDDGGMSDESGAGDRDTVGASIENVTGAESDDVLIGSGKRNVLIGGKGVDTLRGGGGSDRLRAKDGTADAEINCGPGAGDSATVDKKDPKPISC